MAQKAVDGYALAERFHAWSEGEPLVASCLAEAETDVRALAARLEKADEALRAGVELVSHESGWGTWRRMDDPAMYRDAAKFYELARAALSHTQEPTDD